MYASSMRCAETPTVTPYSPTSGQALYQQIGQYFYGIGEIEKARTAFLLAALTTGGFAC